MNNSATTPLKTGSSGRMSPKEFALLGFRLTHPAVVALVGYAILIVIVLLPIDMHTYDQKEQKDVKIPYNFPHRLLIALLLMLPFFLAVYSVNCMMVGHCHAWSWIVAILIIVWSFVTAVVSFSLGSIYI